MSEEIAELEDCKTEMSQHEYEGVFGCQTQEDPSFFRTRFRSKQYRTKKVKWDEIKSQFSSFHPTIMKDPCATPEAMSFSDAFMRHDVTPIHTASMMTIGCGEIDELLDQPQMGVDCNVIRDPDQVYRDVFAQRALLQSRSFDEIEEALAFEFMITEAIELPKSDYLPNGGYLAFKRDEELNCVTEECFGKDQCATKSILRRYINKIECVDGFDMAYDHFMHCDTFEEFLAGDDMQGCLKGFNPRLELGNLVNQMTNQPLQKTKGVSLGWVSPDGHRFWKVNLKRRYCTETGEVQKYDLFPKNKILSFNFGTGPCAYAPVWGYVPVLDVHKSPTGSITTTVNATSRYTKTKVSFHPAGFKQIMQSNMMPFLPYKNSSASLTLCVDPKSETFKFKTETGETRLKEDVVPAEAREENRIAAAVKTIKADQERKDALDKLAAIKEEDDAKELAALEKAEAVAAKKGAK